MISRDFPQMESWGTNKSIVVGRINEGGGGGVRIDEFVAQKEMALLLFGPVKVAVLPSCEWVWEKFW